MEYFINTTNSINFYEFPEQRSLSHTTRILRNWTFELDLIRIYKYKYSNLVEFGSIAKQKRVEHNFSRQSPFDKNAFNVPWLANGGGNVWRSDICVERDEEEDWRTYASSYKF